jgi:hypothetical protein
MQMNRNPSDNDVRGVVTQSLEAVDVPAFDAATIRRKVATGGAQPMRPRAWIPRGALVGVPVAVVLVALLANIPLVRAQVERALHAFAVVNGQTVPLNVQAVSLEQARSQMPFAVIAPVGVPAGLRATINTMSSPSAPQTAHVIFEYSNGSGFPVLTIDESSARNSGPQQLMVTSSRSVGGPPPSDAAGGPGGGGVVAPPPADGAAGGDVAGGAKGTYVMRQIEVRRVNGQTTKRQVEMHPIVWTVRGTHIMLAASPDSLSQNQVDAIRAAMSR